MNEYTEEMSLEDSFLSEQYISHTFASIQAIADCNEYNEYTFSDNSFICFDWLVKGGPIVQAFSSDGKLIYEQLFDKEKEQEEKEKLARYDYCVIIALMKTNTQR